MSIDTPGAADPAGAKLDTATDTFIGFVLPDWLQKATPAQINQLRDSFHHHQSKQASLRTATAALIPLQRFAQEQFEQLLVNHLPKGTKLHTVQWLQVRRNLPRLPSLSWPTYGPEYDRQPALLRLMQNFHEGAELLKGSGLVLSNTDQVLSGDPEKLAQDCRRWDIGGRYQTLLEQVFTPATCALLAEDKRAGLLLAIDIAVLKGELGSEVEAALRAVVQAGSESGLSAYPGLLTLLGCPISDALAFQLRGKGGEEGGVVLYLPSDPKHAFRHFESWSSLNDAMVEALRQQDYRDYFSQLVELEARMGFLDTLDKRLKDTAPDLQVDAATGQGEVFARLVAQQVKRAKDDARILLVPTAQVDLQATKDRLRAWEDAGLGLLNLAGLFIPVVGAILLGQLVVQTLSDVYEGAVDWYHGHQHEALDHMLGVAETLAVAAVVATGATLVARGFQRSAFVDGLEPIELDDGGQRLWQRDLQAYEVTPVSTTPGANGLFGEGDHQCMRVDDRYYSVHRPDPHGPWRLRHPQREGAFGPEVEFNGDRGWRLRHERPLESQDNARMLDMLWPQRVPLSSQRASAVLHVAGVDSAELRGLLVAGRRLPVNLRESLRRFEADDRIEAFFEQMHRDVPASDDQENQRWCLTQPGFNGLDAPTLRERVLERQGAFSEQLLAHLTQPELVPDPLCDLVRRDFPGLPPAYAAALVDDVAEAQRELAVLEQRLPSSLTSQARTMLQQVRVSRALEGLYLKSSYSDQTGELALTMLSRLPHWPRRLNLELREGTESGRRLAVTDPQALEQNTTVMVRREGEFRLYDSQGHEREDDIDAPRGFFEAVVACLTPTELERLDVAGDDPAEALRSGLVQRLPATRTELTNLLGWRSAELGVNSPRRLSNDRIGYLLSGRGQGQRWARSTLRDRIRELFWGLNDTQVDAFLNRLLGLPGSPFEILLQLEAQYRRLNQELSRWASAELNDRRRGVRQHVAGLLRRAWRLQGENAMGADGAVDGTRLDLSGLPLRTLPALPAQTDFGNVSELHLGGLQLSGVPDGFLDGFNTLRRLSLNHNQLLRIPVSIGRLSQLTELQLLANRIRLDLDGVNVLASLSALRHLDLSYNPLGAIALRFNQLPQLRSIGLRRCGLQTWPEGLEVCGFLDSADIRQNQIAQIPEAVMQMPAEFRRSFSVDGNPLSVVERDRFYADSAHQHLPGDSAQPVQPAPEAAEQGVREHLLDTVEEGSRPASSQVWDRLLASPDSAHLFSLLGALERTREYQLSPEHLTGQIWKLLRAIDADSELRLQVFEHAGMAVTCVDSVASRFSELQVRMLVQQVSRGDAGQAHVSEMLGLARRLFRLDEVSSFARGDIAQRRAQWSAESSPNGRRVRIDEVEIDLYYRVHLASELDLPLQPRYMQFGRVANVSSTQLQEAAQRVRAAEATQALARNISQRGFWLNYLRAEHPQAFADIEATFTRRGAELDEASETMTSGTYQEHWDALLIERDAQEHALALRLTEEALQSEAELQR